MSEQYEIELLKIPDAITIGYLESVINNIDSITDFSAAYLVKRFHISIDNEDISSEINEDDLYSLGTESLRVKKAAISYLKEAVEEILFPAVGYDIKNSSPPRIDKGMFIRINNESYIVAGGESRYSYPSNTYCRLKAIKLSSILDNTN